MYSAMSRMLAQCVLFLSQLRGYHKSGSGCLAFRRLKNLRSYRDHHQRVLVCSPKCRYAVPFGDVRLQDLKFVVRYVFCIDNFSTTLILKIKQMMEAATKQIEERKKQLSITSASPVRKYFFLLEHLKKAFFLYDIKFSKFFPSFLPV